jgi:hypothetical protein
LNSDKDCAGVCFGTAALDACEICAGGTTGLALDGDMDCSGACFGSAVEDYCGICTLGDTGLVPNATLDCNHVCGGGYVVESMCNVCEDPAFPVDKLDCDNKCRTSFSSVAEECPEVVVDDGCSADENARKEECFNIASISPKSSSYRGGTKVWITGKGFSYGVDAYLCSFYRDVRCAFFDRTLHSRMPLEPTPVHLK